MPDWDRLFGNITLVQAVLWIVAAGGLIYLLIKLWPFVKHAFAIVDALVQLPAMKKQIDSIHHETHRNDGSSIKDAVGRIEQSLEGVHGRLDQVEADTGVLRTQAEQLAREDEALWAEIENTNQSDSEEEQ